MEGQGSGSSVSTVDDEIAPLSEALLSCVSSEITHSQLVGNTFFFHSLLLSGVQICYTPEQFELVCMCSKHITPSFGLMVH